MNRRPAIIPLLAAAAIACADAENGRDAQPEAVVRDSAGVTIVDNPLPPDSGGSLALSAEPAVTIGVLEGPAEYQLYRVGQPVRMSDGRIAVPNGGTEIRYYSPDGEYLRTVGREGDGPGEFRNVYVVGRVSGDTLLVYDQRSRRLSVMDGEGGFVRAIPLSGEVRFPFPRGMTDSEHVVFTANSGFERMNDAPQGMLQDTQNVFVVPWRGGLEVTAPSFALPGNRIFLSRGEGWGSTQSLPIAAYTNIVARAGGILWAPADGYEFRLLEPDGTPKRIVRVAFESKPLTSAIWDAEVERRLENVDDESWRERQRGIFANMPRPTHLPARGFVAPDAADRVWVQRYGLPSDEPAVEPSAWDVYDGSSRWIAAVHMPAGFVPMDIGADYVLGVHRDELDVEQVRLYSLFSTDAD